MESDMPEGYQSGPAIRYKPASMAGLIQLKRDARPGAEAYLPVSLEDARPRGWEQLDVVLGNGDAYVDHPTFRVPLIPPPPPPPPLQPGTLPPPPSAQA